MVGLAQIGTEVGYSWLHSAIRGKGRECAARLTVAVLLVRVMVLVAAVVVVVALAVVVVVATVVVVVLVVMPLRP